MTISKRDRIVRRATSLILHELKRVWGTPAHFYKISVGTPDLDTGAKGVTSTKYEIPFLISCIAKSLRKFEYDIGYLAANKNFTYGGFFEPTDRFAIVDGSELPENITIEQSDYFLLHSKRYDIQTIQPIDAKAGWFLHLRHTKDNLPYAIYDCSVWNRVTPISTMEIEP